MTTTYHNLMDICDTLVSQGVTPRVTKLPSVVNKNHKTLWTTKSKGKGSTKVS